MIITLTYWAYKDKKKEIENSNIRVRTFGRTQLTFWRNNL